MTTTEQAALCFHLYNPVYPASERTRGLNQECGWDEAFSYGARFAAECERRREPDLVAERYVTGKDGSMRVEFPTIEIANALKESLTTRVYRDAIADEFRKFISNPDRDLRRSCTDAACCGPEERIHVQDLESFLRQTGIYREGK